MRRERTNSVARRWTVSCANVDKHFRELVQITLRHKTGCSENLSNTVVNMFAGGVRVHGKYQPRLLFQIGAKNPLFSSISTKRSLIIMLALARELVFALLRFARKVTQIQFASDLGHGFIDHANEFVLIFGNALKHKQLEMILAA